MIKSTRQQIMEVLSLEDWDSFKRKQEEKNKERSSHLYPADIALRGKIRQTGRTTRTMVSALVVATRGLTVTIYAMSGQMEAHLMQRLQEMAECVGLKKSVVVKENPDVEFYDHTYYGDL